MSPAEFDRLAAQVAPHCGYIYLHIKGEPLLHPALDQILDSAACHKLQVNLTTNALLLADRARLLLDSSALRQTNLSLHGYTPATHGPMQPWMDSLCAYARAMAAQGKYTVFRFWTMPESRYPLEQDTQLLKLLANQFPESGDPVCWPSNRAVTLAPGVFISFEEQFDWPSMGSPDQGGQGICYGGRTMIGILADGTVVPCCLDGDGVCALGNALEQPLDQILTSHRYRSLRDGFTNRQVTEPLCRHCGYRIRFG